jgi:hypothetical protein
MFKHKLLHLLFHIFIFHKREKSLFVGKVSLLIIIDFYVARDGNDFEKSAFNVKSNDQTCYLRLYTI